jgi:hypothetical protein
MVRIAMVIISKSRRTVVHIAPLVLLVAVAFATFVVLRPRPRLWQSIMDYVIASVFLAVGLIKQRVTRRRGDDVDVWRVIGRRRLKAKSVFLGITTGRSSVNISLFLGKSMAPVEPSIMVASYGACGLAYPLQVAKRIADALDMPEPRVAPRLQQYL